MKIRHFFKCSNTLRQSLLCVLKNSGTHKFVVHSLLPIRCLPEFAGVESHAGKRTSGVCTVTIQSSTSLSTGRRAKSDVDDRTE